MVNALVPIFVFSFFPEEEGEGGVISRSTEIPPTSKRTQITIQLERVGVKGGHPRVHQSSMSTKGCSVCLWRRQEGNSSNLEPRTFPKAPMPRFFPNMNWPICTGACSMVEGGHRSRRS